MASVTVVVTKKLFYPAARVGDGHFAVGSKVEMAEGDVSTHVDLGLVAVVGGAEPKTESKNKAESLPTGLAELKSLWDLKSTPAEYLVKFPSGPKSELALNIVTAEAEAAEDEEDAPGGPGTSPVTE